MLTQSPDSKHVKTFTSIDGRTFSKTHSMTDTFMCAYTQTQAGKSCCCWIKQNRPEPVRANSVPAVSATYFLVSLTDTHTHSCHTTVQLRSTQTIYRHDGKQLPFMGEKVRLERWEGRERDWEKYKERSPRSSPCVILHNFINHIIRQENDPRETNRFRFLPSYRRIRLFAF